MSPMVRCLRMGSLARPLGEGRVLHWSGRAVNLLFGRRTITVMSSGGTLSPSSIIVDTDLLPEIAWAVGSERSILAPSLMIALGNEVDLSWRGTIASMEAAVEWLEGYLEPRERSICSALVPPERCGDGLSEAMRQRQRAILQEATRLDELADRLLGLGFGLTPSGDDFVLGTIAMLNLEERDTSRIRRRVERYEHHLSRTMLIDALDGHYAEPLRDVLRCLSLNELEDRSMRRLLGMGSTSGLDTVAGMFFAGDWIRMGKKLPPRLGEP